MAMIEGYILQLQILVIPIFFQVPLLRGQGQMESVYDFVARTGSSREDGQNCLLVGCFCSRSNVCFADTDCRPK